MASFRARCQFNEMTIGSSLAVDSKIEEDSGSRDELKLEEAAAAVEDENGFGSPVVEMFRSAEEVREHALLFVEYDADILSPVGFESIDDLGGSRMVCAGEEGG